MSFAGNYTGPYWSDGTIQPSVEWGASDPQSDLDFLSRQHDSAYAHFKDRGHREAADRLYKAEADKLVGRFPELAGKAVLYGNYAGRQASQLAKDVGMFGGLPGLIKFGVGNIVNAQKMLNGTYLKKETEAVQKYYSSDPKLVRVGLSTDRKQTTNGIQSGENVDLHRMKPTVDKPRQAMNVGVRAEIAAEEPPPRKGGVLKKEVQSKVNEPPPPAFEFKLSKAAKRQAKKLNNYQILQQAAQTKKKLLEIPKWDWRGYRGREQKIRKKYLKTNKVACSCE